MPFFIVYNRGAMVHIIQGLVCTLVMGFSKILVQQKKREVENKILVLYFEKCKQPTMTISQRDQTTTFTTDTLRPFFFLRTGSYDLLSNHTSNHIFYRCSEQLHSQAE